VCKEVTGGVGWGGIATGVGTEANSEFKKMKNPGSRLTIFKKFLNPSALTTGTLFQNSTYLIAFHKHYTKDLDFWYTDFFH
jgi:hypothetical protein